MAEDYQVTAEAFMRLSAALEGMSQNNNVYSREIDEIRQSAQQLQANPQSEQHASLVKNASSSAASILQQIQEAQYPEAQSIVDSRGAAGKGTGN